MTAVVASGVRRAFGKVQALNGVDLSVEPGEIFGLLGPNGSGKTTLFNCLQGIDRPDAGRVEVLGLDPIKQREELNLRVGVQLQAAALIPRLKVREALELFASFYPRTLPVTQVLEELGLSGKADARMEKLSGGQRQRVFIALALLHDPELMFFDELTSAVDPQARQAIWEILRALRAAGRTVMLTTHSMVEAAELCDRVAIIDAGKVIAAGTPHELVREHAAQQRMLLATNAPLLELSNRPGVKDVVEADAGRLQLTGEQGFAPAVLAWLSGEGYEVKDLTLSDPSLDDVFLHLTGRAMREETN